MTSDAVFQLWHFCWHGYAPWRGYAHWRGYAGVVILTLLIFPCYVKSSARFMKYFPFYHKFIIRSIYDSDLQGAKISLKNIAV